MSSMVDVIQELSGSAEFRDKLLKAVQYGFKFAAVLINRFQSEYKPQQMDTLLSAAKTISSARRFVTLLRWVQYFKNIKTANGEHHTGLRFLLFAEVFLNIVVDALQDLVTLDRIGIFGKPSRLPTVVEWAANNLDIVLAINGTSLAFLRSSQARFSLPLESSTSTLNHAPHKSRHTLFPRFARRQHSARDGGDSKEGSLRGSSAIEERWTLLKYVCDVLKCLDAAGVLLTFVVHIIPWRFISAFERRLSGEIHVHP